MKNFSKLFFLLFTVYMFSQESIDISNEEFVNLQAKARFLFNTNRDSSFYYIDRIEKSKNKIHVAYSKGAKSYLLVLKGDFDNANLSFNETFKLFNTIPNSKSKIQNESCIYNYAGHMYFYKEDFSKALDSYIKSKDLATQVNDVVQIIKANMNIAMINSEIGNYNKAIETYKELDKLIGVNQLFYTQQEFFNEKCKINLNLGVAFEDYFYKNRDKTNLLDSSFHYYNKSLLFSENDLSLKLKALKNIGNIHYYKNDFDLAEKNYLTSYSLSKENNYLIEFYCSNYNLGLINFGKKEYNKSLSFFKRVDSLYEIQNSLGIMEFVGSNYRQSVIYDFQNESEKSLEHANIYMSNYEKMSKTQNTNFVEVNKVITDKDISKEVNLLKKKNESTILKKKIFYVLFYLVIVLLIIVIINKFKNKQNYERRIELIVEEYERKNSIKKLSIDETSNKYDVLTISSDNENEIISNLELLIEKGLYLRSDFTQQMVAKKIKTNTTYLSSIVNKRYGKSFSNYLNELRINYVIEEIISNSRYREYTTQAIAESAGFKNADSFTTSFKKKTGVTPYQFIIEIKKRG